MSNGMASIQNQASWNAASWEGKVQGPPKQPSWSGTLAKSGETLCRLVCWDGANIQAWNAAAVQEPQGWPDVLDVRLRVDLNIAIKLEGECSLLYLSAGDTSADREGLVKFIRYLTERRRAGVVQLKDGGGDRSRDRTLYLIPPTDLVAQSLGISSVPKDSLIVLVVPYSGKTKRQNLWQA